MGRVSIETRTFDRLRRLPKASAALACPSPTLSIATCSQNSQRLLPRQPPVAVAEANDAAIPSSALPASAPARALNDHLSSQGRDKGNAREIHTLHGGAGTVGPQWMELARERKPWAKTCRPEGIESTPTANVMMNIRLSRCWKSRKTVNRRVLCTHADYMLNRARNAQCCM